MTDHDQNKEIYTYDAWGEHVDTANTPTRPNNIRYGGAWVEAFASGPGVDAIYLCGERHYWPAYGRFSAAGQDDMAETPGTIATIVMQSVYICG